MPTYTVDIEMHGRGSNMRGLSFATFMRPLNAVPAVVAAPPGVTSAHDLPLVAGVMPRRRMDRRDRVSGVTDDLAGRVVGFLLSDASTYVTGQTLMADGGRVMLR